MTADEYWRIPKIETSSCMDIPKCDNPMCLFVLLPMFWARVGRLKSQPFGVFSNTVPNIPPKFGRKPEKVPNLWLWEKILPRKKYISSFWLPSLGSAVSMFPRRVTLAVEVARSPILDQSGQRIRNASTCRGASESQLGVCENKVGPPVHPFFRNSDANWKLRSIMNRF